jgi:hypothetical protein
MALTERDSAMLAHISEYKYCTIEQIEKIFLKETQFSYNVARRRLLRIMQAGFIKIVRDAASNRNIYILHDPKVNPPSLHRIITLDVLSELHRCGFKVERFDVERSWMNNRFISDAFMIFTVQTDATHLKRYYFFLEVHLSNNAHNLTKYDLIYESGEVQKLFGTFPRILLVSDRQFKDLTLKHVEIVQLNTRLDRFPIILL